jgi:two-component system sensor histidine kinase MprB
MSLRRRIALVCAAAAAVAVVLASVLTYVLTSQQLHNQIDAQLRDRGREPRPALRLIAAAPAGSSLRRLLPGAAPGGAPLTAAERRLQRDLKGLTADQRRRLGLAGFGAPVTGRAPGTGGNTAAVVNPFRSLPPRPDQVRGYQQIVDATGKTVILSPGGLPLPVDARTRALAAHGGKAFLRSVNVKGIHLRVLAEPLDRGDAVQYAQSLGDVDHLLSKLRLILGLLSLGGIVLAAVLARVVAGAALVPVKRLTEATEHVARTQDLTRRIDRAGADEIGRLAASFNAMLDALESSMKALDASAGAQRQLVADASHELRTPVTSLRTNIEFLQQAGDMNEEERRRVLADLVEQVEELTALMNDLIDLARGDGRHELTEDVRLDVLVTEAAARAQRRAPERRFELDLDETLVTGVPDRLDRAVNNLLDNAVKYSPPPAAVEVSLHAGVLTVRDHGTGIPEDDLPHVFDRFYRGADARGRPGSGLGLAIVRQVAESHGGSVSAAAAPGGGTVLVFRLPPAAPSPEPEDDEGILTRTLRAGG